MVLICENMMNKFLERWYTEFKKDREIRENTLLPTM